MRAILRLTFLEMLRKRVLFFTLAMTVIYFALYGLGLHFVYREYQQMEALYKLMISSQMLSMGVYTAGFIVAFLTIFVSAASISGAVDQNAYDVFLAAPVPRNAVFWGRYLGMQLFLLAYAAVMYSGVVLLNVVISGGTAAHVAPLAALKALGVILMLPFSLATVGAYLSTFLPTMASGIILTLMYLCGVVGGFMELIGGLMKNDAGHVLVNIGIVTGLVIPTDVLYRKAYGLLLTTPSGLDLSGMMMTGGASQPSAVMLIYAAVYTLVFLGLGIRRFAQREF